MVGESEKQAFTIKAMGVHVCGLAHQPSVVGPLLALLVAQHEEVKAFDFLASPRCFSQKFQAGVHAGVVREAANRDARAQVVPAIVVGQLGDDGLKGQAVKRVARLSGVRG
jgi:hypothetical protein